MNELNLKGKVAVVCGASKGIGAAVAQVLNEAGAQVVGLSRSRSGFDHIECDFSDLKAVETSAKEVLSKYKNVHILINNSGGPKSGLLLEAEVQTMAQAFSQHVLASQLLAKAFVPSMKSEKYGRIINVISTSVKTPIANLGVSNTVRAAMANWAKSLANELGPYGITVNNLLPGFTQTERLDSLRKATAESMKVSEADVDLMWLKTIPLGKFATARDLGLAALFLASPMASYISGINLPVDGGRTPAL